MVHHGPGRSYCRRFLLLAFVAAALLAAHTQVLAGVKLVGQWSVTLTYPASPGSHDLQTVTVMLDVSPKGNSLVGRMTITDAGNNTVGGVWRQVGRGVFVTYELPCSGTAGTTCATLILRGKLKGDAIKNGKVIVMWDTADSHNPAQYDTSNGSFTGVRVSTNALPSALQANSTTSTADRATQFLSCPRIPLRHGPTTNGK
jgi:hypothetical protein